jgi:hypothetical protein
MRSLSPAWESLEDWFSWPPDVFLLTSTILKSTGAYRYVVSPPRDLWPQATHWQTTVVNTAREWRRWLVHARPLLPRFLDSRRRILERYWEEIPVDSLGSISPQNSRTSEGRRAWSLCKALLELHAAADETCRGLGFPAGRLAWTTGKVRSVRISELSAFHFLANLLLVTTGSLSRLARSHGVVLPKARTPQVGLTLRSISHHVTFHQSEVRVDWRTMPWVNIDENTINVLIVPWPSEMEATWFRPLPLMVRRRSAEPSRYFAYSRGGAEFSTEELSTLLDDAEKTAKRVHMIVFPELSLTLDELARVKDLLARRNRRDGVPMIVAGLCDRTTAAEQPVESGLGSNRIVLSTFFAGKWYDLYQSKHHRWRLDSGQIQQYGLSGVLAGTKDWWEAIDIPERRLMFLAPNGWLTLCPLVCEDLARLEPISDLIRGVGPTLLFAILLDGPQIRERWPGRYASVLAEDPGTSVLTVSSLGMANRSTPQMRPDLEGHVALWKDQLKGWREVVLRPGEKAAIVTLGASWYEEYTADGRGDQRAAAVFALQGVVGLRSNEAARAISPAASDRWEPAHYDTSDDRDVLEMSTFAYFVDAALDSSQEGVDNLRSWATNGRSGSDWLARHLRAGDAILDLVLASHSRPTKEFYFLVGWFADLLGRVTQSATDGGDMSYWEELIAAAKSVLSNATADTFRKSIANGDTLDRALADGLPVHEAVRVQVYSSLSLLWAVHRRLARRRREVGLTHTTAELMHVIETLLAGKYDVEWYRAREKGALRLVS